MRVLLVQGREVYGIVYNFEEGEIDNYKPEFELLTHANALDFESLLRISASRAVFGKGVRLKVR